MGAIFLTFLRSTSFEFLKITVNMFRLSVQRFGSVLRDRVSTKLVNNGGATYRWMGSAKSSETDAEFDARYEAYFNRKDIDGWEIRKGMADLAGMDLVPEPAIVSAALRACRRVNDYALTTRILEVVKLKAAHNPEIWPYMMQELKPTMEELGIASLEDMGYDKPEMAIDPEFRN